MSAEFYVRSLTVPVDAVVLDGQPWTEENTREGWRRFKLALAVSWRRCAQAANTWVRELAMLDNAPLVFGEKGPALPQMPVMANSNPKFKAAKDRVAAEFTDLESQSFWAVIRRAGSDYLKHRREVRLLCSRSLPSFGAWLPLSIPAKKSPLWIDAEGRVVLKLSISPQPLRRKSSRPDRAECPGGTFLVRLKETGNFARQLGPIRRAANGDLARAEVTLREGGNKQVLLATSVSLPKVERQGEEVLTVSTDANAFLVADHGSARVFVLNEDGLRLVEQCRARTLAHQAALQRTRQDLKAERRMEPRSLKNRLRWLERTCDKHRRRVNDALHKAARMVANYAARRRCALVMYDDTVRSYLPEFAWFSLRTLIEQKLDEHGIAFKYLGLCDAEAESPSETSRRMKVTCQAMDNVAKATERAAETVSRGRRKSHPKVSTPPKTPSP